MPCNSDYLQPSYREAELARAAKLMLYVANKLGFQPAAALESDAKSLYGGADYVPSLCQAIRGMTPEQVNSIVYNAKDRTARDLADWWEDHQKADADREEKEARAIREREDHDKREWERLSKKFS